MICSSEKGFDREHVICVAHIVHPTASLWVPYNVAKVMLIFKTLCSTLALRFEHRPGMLIGCLQDRDR